VPAASVLDRRADVQAIDKHRVLVEGAIAVGILVDGDAVRALDAMRRRQRHLVVDRAEKIVRAHRLEPRGIRILPILHDPQPSAFVEIAKHRLRDVGFREDEFPHEIVRRGERAGGFRGRERRRGIGERRSGEQRRCHEKRYGVRQLVGALEAGDLSPVAGPTAGDKSPPPRKRRRVGALHRGLFRNHRAPRFGRWRWNK